MSTPGLIVVMWALALLPTELLVIYYNVSRDSSLESFIAIVGTIQVVILLVGAAGGTVMMTRDGIQSFRFRRTKAIPVAIADAAGAGDC